MLALPHTNSWGFVYDPTTNGTFSPGTSVTPGATSAEGSWTEIASDASITTDIMYVMLWVTGGFTSGASKAQFLDFGWDPAGGTSYIAFFQDLVIGGSAGTPTSTVANTGRFFHFPCRIPSGSAIAVRIQGANGTAGTVRVASKYYGKPSRPELWRPAAYSETLGAGGSTLGAAFTPGNAGWGSWASLGTTTKKHFWAQLGAHIDNGTCTGEMTKLQLAIGDVTNKHVIVDTFLLSQNFEGCANELQAQCCWEIPAGAELWVRGNCSGAPTSGYNATAVLFGG